jgi:hypothetical protein
MGWQNFNWNRKRSMTASWDSTQRVGEASVGATGSGKTETQKRDAWNRFKAGEAVLMADPMGTAARSLHSHAVRNGRANDVYLDDLAHHHEVLVYQAVERSQAADPLARMRENAILREEAKERLAQARGHKNFDEKPGLDSIFDLALRFWQDQPPTVEQDALRDVLAIGTTGWYSLLKTCTVQRTSFEMEVLADKPGRSRGEVLQWARAAWDKVFGNITVMTRLCGKAIDLADVLMPGKMLLIAGDYRVQQEGMRFMMLSAILKAFRVAAQHKAKAGKPLAMSIYADECNAHPWMTRSVCSYCVQGRQWGVRFCPAFQFLDKDNAYVNQVILNNFDLNVHLQKDPDSTHLLARALATLHLNAQATKDVQVRDRTLTLGYEQQRVTTASVHKDARGKETKGQSEHIFNKPILGAVQDEQKTFLPLNEQILLYEKAIMSLEVGHRLVKRGNYASTPDKPEKVIPLEEQRWASLASSRADQALSAMRSRWPFQKPDLSRLLPPAPTPEPPPPATKPRRRGVR